MARQSQAIVLVSTEAYLHLEIAQDSLHLTMEAIRIERQLRQVYHDSWLVQTSEIVMADCRACMSKALEEFGEDHSQDLADIFFRQGILIADIKRIVLSKIISAVTSLPEEFQLTLAMNKQIAAVEAFESRLLTDSNTDPNQEKVQLAYRVATHRRLNY